MKEYIVRIDLAPDGMLVYHRPHGEIVRCKDCKHFKRDIPYVGGTYNGCDQLEGRDGCEPYVEEDFFCAYGERRTDETERR